MTQRDGMGSEVGGGFRMGNTCAPVVDSCECMAKPIQYCKVISLQIINTLKKKKNTGVCSHSLLQGEEMEPIDGTRVSCIAGRFFTN